MLIRFANKTDQNQILDLLDQLLEHGSRLRGVLYQKPANNDARSLLFEKELKRKDIKIFVAEENEKLIGVSEFFTVPILRRGYYQGVIETLVVSEKFRGKGVGSALLAQIFDFCKKQKIKVVKLTSALELSEAHEFYQKHGGINTEKMFRFDL